MQQIERRTANVSKAEKEAIQISRFIDYCEKELEKQDQAIETQTGLFDEPIKLPKDKRQQDLPF